MPVLSDQARAPKIAADLPKRIFSPIADGYDRSALVLSLFQYRRWHRFLLSRLNLEPGTRVLDMATGTGALALDLLARPSVQIVGGDITRQMLIQAQRRVNGRSAGRLGLVECSAESPPFADECFDAITFAYLLRYVSDVPETLRALAALLRSGGTMASLDFAVPHGVCNPLWRVYTDAVLPASGRLFSRDWRDVGALSGSEHSRLLPALAGGAPGGSVAGRRVRGCAVAQALARWGDRDLGKEGRMKVRILGGVRDAPAGRLYVEVDGARPAFYALERGGWRDYVTLLHLPYTLWHLSYVVLGAALSPTLREDRLGATLLAFFLAVGVSAHALDELNGRPLRTHIPREVLIALGVAGLVGAMAIGIAGAVFASPWLLAFVAFGAFIAPAYNLEWFRGRFHSDLWFAVSWGAFPFVTAYYASAERFEASVLFGAAAVFALSLAQRTLSRRVRTVRRQIMAIEGRVVNADGTVEDIDRRWVLGADERALMLMAAAVSAMALAALAARA